MALEKMIFKKISMISLWELKITGGVANLDHRGMVGRIYVGDH